VTFIKKIDKNIKANIFYIMLIFSCILGLIYFDTIIQYTNNFLDTISPFIWSAAITFLLCPLVKKINYLLDKIHKFKANRIISIIITYLLFLSFIIFIFACVLPDVFNSIVEIFSKVPEYFDELQKFLIKHNINIVNFNEIENLFNEKAQETVNFITKSIPEILSVSMNIVGTLFSMLISFVFSIYIMVDLERIKRYVNNASNIILGDKKHQKVKKVLYDCSSSINNFLIGKIIDSIIIGILLFIILNIFGFKYSLLISFIVGVTNIIPDIGPIIGAIPGILLYLAISPKDALVFFIIILCLQQFDGMILGPKILGEKLGIRPIIILPSVIIGGHCFGIVGMVLGVPLATVASVYFNKYLENKKERKNKDETKNEEE
jgi:predicted PurR-regulated permease PerM